MSIIDRLASSLNRKDEVPNQELALQIVETNDEAAVKELVVHLHNKNKDIQNDCVKVLYEVGERQPLLISNYLNDFVDLLNSKNNRMQWGAMTALDALTLVQPREIYEVLPKIIEAADKGSVITKDHAVAVLIKLCSMNQFASDAFDLLVDQLINCPTNQLPMYAENAVPVIDPSKKERFVKLLQSRLGEIEKESKRNRLEKVIKKVEKVK